MPETRALIRRSNEKIISGHQPPTAVCSNALVLARNFRPLAGRPRVDGRTRDAPGPPFLQRTSFAALGRLVAGLPRWFAVKKTGRLAAAMRANRQKRRRSTKPRRAPCRGAPAAYWRC